MVENAHAQLRTEQSRKYTASNVERLNFARHIGNGSRWIHFRSDKFTTGSRIDALNANTQTLLSRLKQTALDRLRVRLNVV